MNDPFAHQREEVGRRLIDDRYHYRILVVGQFANGTTDIVACLIRALRNLGHHVLFFDVKRHRGLLSNPHSARGGFGPIYVEGEYLKKAVARFRPQIVLLLANGMAFKPEDAEWMRQQGAVVTGVTLSDPDVLESVAGFAGSFDFHTTNAQRALAMYEERGIRNTFYFPFGIDRGYISQAVPHNPALEADVICLGHATARAERNSVMKAINSRLDGRFRVRTYGRGWTLPGSRPVEGIEMLQASRAGRVHINFPATRAGYTNVKCGIFETVGSGSLLVTQRFEEMERFFEYDTEIVGYDNYEELPDLLEALLKDEGRIEAMASQAFQRVITEHLYEHRWIELFETMRTADATAWLGERRGGEIREILSQSQPRCRPILLSGYYGARNLGDDLILSAIANAMESHVPGARVTVAAQSALNVEKEQGYQAFNRTDTAEADYLATTADAIILGGGGLWHDYTFEKAGGLPGLFHGSSISVTGFAVLPMLGHFRQVPFHVVGMGVGPLSDPDAKVMVGYLARTASSVTVRDEASKEILDRLLGSTDLAVNAPDVVYSVDLPQLVAETGERPDASFLTIGVNLRPWMRGDRAVVDELADAIATLTRTEQRPVRIVMLPMQEGPSLDRATLGRLQERLDGSFPIAEMSTPLNLNEYIDRLRKVDVLIAMRLHACLLAHRIGVPTVGLTYDPKVAVHFEELGRGKYALPLSVKSREIVAAVRDAISTPFDDTFFKRRCALEAASTARLAEVARIITESEPNFIPWMVPKTYALPEIQHVDGGGTGLKQPRQQASGAGHQRLKRGLAALARRHPSLRQILPKRIEEVVRGWVQN